MRLLFTGRSVTGERKWVVLNTSCFVYMVLRQLLNQSFISRSLLPSKTRLPLSKIRQYQIKDIPYVWEICCENDPPRLDVDKKWNNKLYNMRLTLTKSSAKGIMPEQEARSFVQRKNEEAGDFFFSSPIHIYGLWYVIQSDNLLWRGTT